MALNSDILALALVIAPESRVSLTAAASASTTAQGQFSTVDASTAILTRPSTGNLAVNIVLNPSPFAAASADGLVDDNGLLFIMVDQGNNAQTVNSITVATGTLAFQFVGTRYGLFVVAPGNNAIVSATIALSAGNATSRVTLASRTFNATNTISTL